MPIYIYAWICVHSYSILAAMNQTKNSMSDQKKKKPRTLSPYLAIVLDFFDLYPWLQSIVLIWAELSYSVSLKVNDELNKYSANISGVPYYVVCDKSSTVLVLFTSLYIILNAYFRHWGTISVSFWTGKWKAQVEWWAAHRGFPQSFWSCCKLTASFCYLYFVLLYKK